MYTQFKQINYKQYSHFCTIINKLFSYVNVSIIIGQARLWGFMCRILSSSYDKCVIENCIRLLKSKPWANLSSVSRRIIVDVGAHPSVYVILQYPFSYMNALSTATQLPYKLQEREHLVIFQSELRQSPLRFHDLRILILHTQSSMELLYIHTAFRLIKF